MNAALTTRVARRLLTLAVLSLALLATPSLAQAAQVGAVADITWGQSKADVDREVELLRGAGVRWVRANINWAGLEKDGKGQINSWQLAEYDYAVDRARAAGMQVLLPISDGVPYWASSDPKKYVDQWGGKHWNKMYPPTRMADYGDIVRFVASHFKAKGVSTYEIWNEPNLVWFWASGPNPAQYVEMLKQGYQAVKSVDPNATVIMGGLSKSDFAYLEGVYRAGGRAYFDAVAVHPYTYGVDPTVTWKGVNADEDPSRLSKNSFPAIQEIRNTMVANGDSGKQVWITEFGYSTTSADGGVSETRQAEYLSKAYGYVEKFSWVHSLFWYGARNSPFMGNGDHYEAQFGLMTTDFRLKPSYGAFKRAAASANTGSRAAGATRPAVTQRVTSRRKPGPRAGRGRASVSRPRASRALRGATRVRGARMSMRSRPARRAR